MTKEQENIEINLLHEYLKKVLSSKESAKKFLIELGVNDINGKLTENYK